MRVCLRDVLGRLAVCVVLLASAAGQASNAPQEELQREAMKKFGFLVGKWSGSCLWFTRKGVLNLVTTENVHYEQNGLTLKIHGRSANQTASQSVSQSSAFLMTKSQTSIAYAQTHVTKRALLELTTSGAA